ncbi:uncharacterized protein LOC135439179 [Drosophila montana]|uniref:uncharacterized protein LOC135439179 n=1 Tax=Drosophila montana TaxID=40370 RepID=UPI00313EDBEC
MEQLIDVSCIKKEHTEANNEDKYNEPKHCNASKVNTATNLDMEKLEVTEMDIGPIKIEPGVNREIKMEYEEAQQKLQSVEHAVSGKYTVSQRAQASHQLPAVVKSNNRRIIVRELHQRLLKLDMAIKPSKRSAADPRSLPPPKSSAQRMREMRQRRRKADSATHPPNRQRMQDLRQRLMNLEQPIKLPASKTSTQKSSELHSRLLQPENVQTPAKNSENKSSEIPRIRTTPKSSAQRMRELRQRRRDLQNDNTPAEQKRSTKNSRPQTPPDLSVKRMREFRQRLLELDTSHKGKHSESMRKTDEVRIC